MNEVGNPDKEASARADAAADGGLLEPAGAARSASVDVSVHGLLVLLPELKLMIGLVTTATLIAGLYFGRDILVPLALAVFLGFVLDPLVVRLRRLGLPRTAAVVVVTIATLALIALSGIFLANQISTLSARLPTYQNNIAEKLRGLRQDADRPGMFDGVAETFETFRREINVAPSVAAPPPAPAYRPTCRRVAC